MIKKQKLNKSKNPLVKRKTEHQLGLSGSSRIRNCHFKFSKPIKFVNSVIHNY